MRQPTWESNSYGPWRHMRFQHTLSICPALPIQPINTHPVNIACQYTHPVNTPCQYTLSIQPINTPCQQFPSTHPIIHPITHPLTRPSFLYTGLHAVHPRCPHQRHHHSHRLPGKQAHPIIIPILSTHPINTPTIIPINTP